MADILFNGVLQKRNKYGIYQQKQLYIYKNHYLSYNSVNHPNEILKYKIVKYDIEMPDLKIMICIAPKVLIFKAKNMQQKIELAKSLKIISKNSYKLEQKQQEENIDIESFIPGNRKQFDDEQKHIYSKLLHFFAISLIGGFLIMNSTSTLFYHLFLYLFDKIPISFIIYMYIWSRIFKSALYSLLNSSNSSLYSKEKLYQLLEESIYNKFNITKKQLLEQDQINNLNHDEIIDIKELNIISNKIINAQNTLQELSNSNDFKFLKKSNTISIFIKEFSNSSLLPMFKGIGIIKFPPKIVANYLYSVKNKLEYDSMFSDKSSIIYDISKHFPHLQDDHIRLCCYIIFIKQFHLLKFSEIFHY